MKPVIYVNQHQDLKPAIQREHCYFKVDLDGGVCREIDLSDTYPYVAFPVNHQEFSLCSTYQRWGKPVRLCDGRLERTAEVLRTTSLGVVSFRFVDEARPVGT